MNRQELAKAIHDYGYLRADAGTEEGYNEIDQPEACKLEARILAAFEELQTSEARCAHDLHMAHQEIAGRQLQIDFAKARISKLESELAMVQKSSAAMISHQAARIAEEQRRSDPLDT
jgi:hypothetical protein